MAAVLMMSVKLATLQSWTKYLRQTLVFILNSALWEKFNFCFSGFFARLTKILIWEEEWVLGNKSMKF